MFMIGAGPSSDVCCGSLELPPPGRRSRERFRDGVAVGVQTLAADFPSTLSGPPIVADVLSFAELSTSDFLKFTLGSCSG
jgi:hypothetical protein